MLCGRCGYTNLQDASYCAICGSKLDGEPQQAPVDPVGSVPCPHCEELNEPIAVHCRFCGKKMKSAKKRATSKAAKKRETHPEEEPEKSPEAIAPEQPDMPAEPENLELENPEMNEMKVLLGLDAEEEDAGIPDASEPPPTIEDLEAEMDELDAMLSSLHDDENNDVEPEPETEQKPEPEADASHAPEVEEATEPEPAEEPIPEPDPVTEVEPTPVAEAPIVPSDPGGMITDPDEMAKLIASIKSEEPEPAPETEATQEPESAEEPEPPEEPEADSAPAPETPTAEIEKISDEDLSGYPSTPHESVVANPRELGEEGDDEEEQQPEAQEEVTLPDAADVAGKALSASLDSMISELLEAEVKEPGEHDYVLYEEAAFPPKTRAAYRKKNVINAKDLFFNVFVATTTLLCGFSAGLWLSYFFM